MNLKEYVEKNPKLAQIKESVRYPGLFVLKYKRTVFYNNLWDENLVEIRGRVINSAGDTVVNPFTKIFNRFENDTDIDRDEQVLAVCKVNGFMAGITYVPEIDEVIVSTTGSLDSDFVTLAEKYLNPIKKDVKDRFLINGQRFTWLFEIVDETDPHIIKEKVGAYLIGVRGIDEERYSSSETIEKTLDVIAKEFGVMRPQWLVARFDAVVKMAKECTNEGFVVYGMQSKTSLKIKTPYYLISKFLARCGQAKLEHMLTHPDWINWNTIDEEFFPLIRYLSANKDDYLNMDEQDRLTYIQSFIEREIYV